MERPPPEAPPLGQGQGGRHREYRCPHVCRLAPRGSQERQKDAVALAMRASGRHRWQGWDEDLRVEESVAQCSRGDHTATAALVAWLGCPFSQVSLDSSSEHFLFTGSYSL